MEREDCVCSCWEDTLRHLNAEQHWGFTDAECATCITALRPLIATSCDKETFIRACHNYYEDRHIVAALRTGSDDLAAQQLNQWMTSILPIIRLNKLYHVGDHAIEEHDLVQVAALGVLNALSRFCYTSRFTTWAYTVILNSVRHYLRDLNTKKRSAPLVSLDDPTVTNLSSKAMPLEQTVVLRETIHDAFITLYHHHGPRNTRLIYYATAYDYHPTAIASLTKLSAARVRFLLAQSYKYIRTHPGFYECL